MSELEELQAETTRVAAERREIEILVESTRAEVSRLRVREESVAGTAEHVPAIERRAMMAAELAGLEAKHTLLGRLEALLARAVTSATGGAAAAAARRPEAPPPAGAVNEKALLRAVAATQEEERRRIARAVHDGPAQAMANVVLQSEISERVFTVDPAASRDELVSLRVMVNKTLQELRGFIFELRPMILDDLGLVPTLRRYIQTLVDKHHVKVDFTSTGRDHRLPTDDEVAIFRLLQDALIERVQRADAKTLALALEWKDDTLEMRLQSDGRAKAAAAAAASGLSREERVNLLGGVAEEEARTDGSIVLTVRVPLAASRAGA